MYKISKKKMVFIIPIIIVLIISSILFYQINTNMKENGNTTNSESSNLNAADGNDVGNMAIGSSRSSKNISTSEDDRGASNDKEQNQESSVTTEATESGTAAHGDDPALYNTGMSATGEKLLNGKNQDEIKKTAEAFIAKFRTFDYGILSNGSWRQSVTPYVDSDLISSNTNDSLNMLYKTYGDRNWDVTSGQYSLYTNAVNSIDSSKTKLDGSRDTGYKFDCIICYVTAVERGQNTLEPNNTNFWQSIDEARVTYRISIVPSTLKIYRVAVSDRYVINSDTNGWTKSHNYAGVETKKEDSNNPFGIDLNDPSYKEMVENMNKRHGI